jgi:pimeloyl-ACP methyl ester carboxylesterase
MGQRASVPILIMLLALSVPTVVAEEPASGEDDLAKAARLLSELFLTGEYERSHELMSDRMRQAFTTEMASRVRDDLLAQKGAVKTIGDAWHEDDVEGYTRYRVPIELERDTLDFRVVFDDDGKVAGFFHAPHVPSPAERAADETLKAKPNPAVEGHWEGSIEIPGATLGVLVDLHNKDGYWVGTIDIPMQAASGLPLEGIRIGETDVEFAIANIPGAPTFRGKLADGRIAGEFTQGGQTFPFFLGREEIARPGRPQEPEPPLPYEEEEVSFANGDITLAGTLTVPPGDGPFPAVLLVSGSGPQDRNEEVFDHKPFLVLSDHLTRAGIAVLRFDDRGTGESTGEFATATSEDFAADVVAGVDFLQGRPETDPEKIGLVGHSEGGLIAPMVAVKSDGVAFVVLLAGPGVPGEELLIRQVELLTRAAGLPEEDVAEIAKAQRELLGLVNSGAPDDEIRKVLRRLVAAQAGDGLSEQAMDEAVAGELPQLTSPWFRYFLSYDPRPTLREVDVPILALNGEKDLQVDPTQNLPEIREALEAGGNTDIVIEEMPGLNHLFQNAETGAVAEYYSIEETMNPALLEKVASWILERFGEPSSTRG